MSGIEITKKLPYVYVKIKNIDNDVDYNKFENLWLDLYKEKKNFIFIININNVENVNMIYAYKMVNLIQTLKKKEIQYLNYSILIVNGYIIRNILNIVFKLTRPVAPIYIVDKNDYTSELINNIKNKKELSSSISYVSP
tara:strand:- start:691 stop:1107 length:417 start_codon:yes stop_codon:yes gene_type:complete